MGLMVIISFKTLLKTKTGKEFIQVRGQMRVMQYELYVYTISYWKKNVDSILKPFELNNVFINTCKYKGKVRATKPSLPLRQIY